jgi:F-type H+-transporting ATPase subunit b
MRARMWQSVSIPALLAANVALGAEEAHPHALGIPWANLLFSTINLLIFLWILARYVLPAGRDLVRERRTRVTTSIEAAANAKADAERLRDEWAVRLRGLEREIERLRGEALADAERERERILAAARATADAIRRDAERTSAQAVRQAIERLRAELVRQSTQLAVVDLRENWTADDQAASVTAFLSQVQR